MPKMEEEEFKTMNEKQIKRYEALLKLEKIAQTSVGDCVYNAVHGMIDDNKIESLTKDLNEKETEAAKTQKSDDEKKISEINEQIDTKIQEAR